MEDICSCVELAYDASKAYFIRKGDNEPHFFAKLHKMEPALACIEAISMLWSGYQLLEETERKYSIIHLANLYPLTSTVCIIAGMAAVIFTVCFINRALQPTTALPQGAAWDKPLIEHVHQSIYLARIAINVAKIGLVIPTLSLFLKSYALIKISVRKWIECKRSYEIVNQVLRQYADRISVSYHSLLQSNQKKEEVNCSICLENDPLPDVHFCPSHLFHTSCIVNTANTKIESFTNGLTVTSREVKETRHYTNGIYTGSTYRAHYGITVPQSNIPACPNCRERPSYNKFEVYFHDLRYGHSASTITWRE